MRAALLIILVGLACYVNSPWGGFTFDDVDMVENNVLIRSLRNTPEIFRTTWWWGGAHRQSHEYRPLTVFSFAVNYFVNGLRPFGYRLMNVLLHALASVLLFYFLIRLGVERRSGLAAALLFASHPVHTEVVNNVVGRAELLSAVFVFSALILYTIALRKERQLSLLYYALSAISFFLGLLSKETAVAFLPAVVLIILLAPGLRRDAGDMRPRVAKRLWMPFALYVLVFCFYMLMRRNALGGFVSSGMRISVLDNVLIEARQKGALVAYYATVLKAFGIYVHLLIAPIDLTADYSYNEVPLEWSFFNMATLCSLAVLLGIIVLTYHFWRKREALPLFGILFFLCAIAPVSNAFKLIGTLVGERLLYLPSAGFCIFLAWALKRGAERLATGKGRRRVNPGRILAGSCAVLVLAYGVRCLLRNPVWKDDMTLYLTTIKTSPGAARIYNNLGSLLMQDVAHNQEALSYFDRALRIAPFYGTPMSNKAELLRRMGRYGDAAGLLEKVIYMEPDYPPAHYYLAETLRDMGQKERQPQLFKRAADEYNIAIRLKPTVYIFYVRLGELYLDYHASPEQAGEYFKRAHELDPASPLPLIGLGRLEMGAGRHEKAGELFREASRLLPGDPIAPYYMGMLALEEGKPAEAERWFLEVLRLAPDDPVSYLNLARLYKDNLKRPQDAGRYYREFIHRFPSHPERSEAEEALSGQKSK
jgi:tetratricopeptide (TPR) repeat protein